MPWLPGSQVKSVDGNGREASEQRLQARRGVEAGAFPGKSLVVYEPASGFVRDVLPCEDGHAQERSWCTAVRCTVPAGDLWIAERHFWTRDWLCDLATRGAAFVIRQPRGLPCELVNSLHPLGRVETGHIAAQRGRGMDGQGVAPTFRRLRIKFNHATRDGATVLSILTNVPARTGSAQRVAGLYRKRWTLETAFQPLEASCHSEIKT